MEGTAENIDAAANRWVLLLGNGEHGVPAEQIEEFLAWFAKDPAHREAYIEYLTFWKYLDLVGSIARGSFLASIRPSELLPDENAEVAPTPGSKVWIHKALERIRTYVLAMGERWPEFFSRTFEESKTSWELPPQFAKSDPEALACYEHLKTATPREWLRLIRALLQQIQLELREPGHTAVAHARSTAAVLAATHSNINPRH